MIAVEAAFAFPVIIIAAMIAMELANIALTINMGDIALQRAVQKVRNDDSWGTGGEGVIRSYMIAASHGYVTDNNIVNVEVEEFESLDEMGQALAEDGGGGSSEDEKDEEENEDSTYPAWKITVDIRKDFITPLPRMLAAYDNDFQYRFEQILCYLPRQDED